MRAKIFASTSLALIESGYLETVLRWAVAVAVLLDWGFDNLGDQGFGETVDFRVYRDDYL